MVMFWDTSAVIPLTVIEAGTPTVRKVLEADESIAVWWATRVECVSAMARKGRERALSQESARNALDLVKTLSCAWTEVAPSQILREIAERLLVRTSLRAADALQLAAALVWAGPNSRGRSFVSLDDRLRDAARCEGFEVLPRSSPDGAVASG